MITFNAVFPVFVANNLSDLAAFYQQTFGFEVAFIDPSFYLHLKHPGNGAEIGFLSPDHPTQPAFLHPLPGKDGYVFSFEVTDARAALSAAESMNLDMAMPYKEEPWGQRHFMVRDPSGLVLDIVEHFEPGE